MPRSTKRARISGFEVRRGDFAGTADNRYDRWYICAAGEPNKCQGRGYRTRILALDAVAALLDGNDHAACPHD